MESGICVANHTSPVDIVCLGSDHSYAMVGGMFNLSDKIIQY